VIRLFSISALAAALGLGLTGCGDAQRQEAVRHYLQAHPPEGFEVAAIPDSFTIVRKADGTSETVVAMHYRLAQPTVEVRDALALPQGREISKRIATVRGWALASLPAGHPTREEIAAASAAARTEIPAKRIVTPKGTDFETLAVLLLRKEPSGWQVTPEALAIHAPGNPDSDPNIPFENSPEVAAKYDALASVARQLEQSRGKYLADRKLAAAQSLANIRSRLRTGNTFEGTLPDRTPARLVISRGADAGEPVAAILTIQGGEQSSSARYVGGMVQQPSGEYALRAAQITSLSGPGENPATDASLHPILTLISTGNGLSAQIKAGSNPPMALDFQQAEAVDLIPDPSIQSTENE
jgi:hypothetical protein